ncbi:hypothetical protein SASPL_157901 [Salvia splendens]|uniref:Uncharacterized protein n=1 Tax=Salvia splendens TaxID=180675 RepID=A0A8X8VU59_SALSN|nr:hypothetical protein SASPL_157901 [Salvia splendens]
MTMTHEFKFDPHGDALTTSLKAAVAVISILSISLAAYSAIHDPTQPLLLARPDQISSAPTTPHQRLPPRLRHRRVDRHLVERARYSDLWWKPGSTRGYVFLEKDPVGSVGLIGSIIDHRVSSEWRRFRRTKGLESAVRIARVVADLYRVRLPGVRWFVMGDDDTVFFPENLAAVLGRHDHRRMVYVGGNSESVEQDVEHAYDMAFGGGGFAVSYPLAAELAASMDGCLDRYHYFYGSDQRVWACVGNSVSANREPGFHQEEGSERTVTTYRKAGDRVMSNGCNKDFAHAMAIENVTVLAPKMEQQEWDQVST